MKFRRYAGVALAWSLALAHAACAKSSPVAGTDAATETITVRIDDLPRTGAKL